MKPVEKIDLLNKSLVDSIRLAQEKAIKEFEAKYEVKVLLHTDHKIDVGMALEYSYLKELKIS